MAALAKRRPVFHSEADFQHELGWTLKEHHNGIKVRFEYPVPLASEHGSIDIWLHEGPTVIELKYWTRRIELTVENERFDLRQQGRQPPNRHAFWKDVARSEKLYRKGHVQNGYIIALTNESGYWNKGKPHTIDTKFRLHEGQETSGELMWKAGAKSARGLAPLALFGHYHTHWRNYSAPAPDKPGGEFRYLLLDVGAGLAAR